MEHPSELQQPQRPNKPRAAATGATRAEVQSTSGSLGEPSLMVGRAGDGQSWYEQVTHEDARKNANKRKRTDTDQQAPGHPFSLGSEPDRKEAMSAIYEHMAGQELPQKNITSWAISAYYPNFTPTAVKTVASQVLCMIAEYHLACATRGSMTTSPILPEAVEQYLPPLVDYAHPGSTGLTDVRVHDHKARSLCVGVWLHLVDMSLSWEKEASESLVQSRHSKGLLLSYLLAPSGDITVSPEEVEMLTGDPTSVAGEMAKLQVSSPNSHKPEDGGTSQ